MGLSAGQVVQAATEGIVARRSVLGVTAEQHQPRVRPSRALQYPHDQISGASGHDPRAHHMRGPHRAAARAV